MEFNIFLDTSFFVRLLQKDNKLYENANDYYEYFLNKKESKLKISTIAIAEYCVKGKIKDLPLEHLEIVPFNLNHAKKTGEFAEILFGKKEELQLDKRTIIPNDSKLLSQAFIDSQAFLNNEKLKKVKNYFLTSDKTLSKLYATLKENNIQLNFEIIDINTSCDDFFKTQKSLFSN